MADARSDATRTLEDRKELQFHERYRLSDHDSGADMAEACALAADAAAGLAPFEIHPLHEAVLKGDLLTAREILDESPDSIDRKDEDGWTALHYAAVGQSPLICLMLLARGAKQQPGPSGLGPFELAIDEEQAIQSLKRTDSGWHIVLKPLDVRPVTRMFLGHPEKPFTKNPIKATYDLSKKTSFQKSTPLQQALNIRDIKAIRAALDAYPDSIEKVDHFGRTPLYTAASRGMAEACDLLLSRGATNRIVKVFESRERPRILTTPLQAIERIGTHRQKISYVAKQILAVFHKYGITSNQQIRPTRAASVVPSALSEATAASPAIYPPALQRR